MMITLIDKCDFVNLRIIIFLPQKMCFFKKSKVRLKRLLGYVFSYIEVFIVYGCTKLTINQKQQTINLKKITFDTQTH